VAKANGHASSLDQLRSLALPQRRVEVDGLSDGILLRGLTAQEAIDATKAWEASGAGDNPLYLNALMVAYGAVEPVIGADQVEVVLGLPAVLVAELAVVVAELTGATEEAISRAAEAFR
jgi:hypothetical protein